MSEALRRTFADPRRTALVLAILVALALAAAHAIEAMGYAPCPLCLYQRYPYYAALPVLAAGALVGWPRAALAVAAVLFLVDFGIAAFHVGVEQGIFSLPESCAAQGRAATLEELRAQVMGTVPRCDRPEFFLLGLTLAAWNALFALALSLAALSGLLLGRRTA